MKLIVLFALATSLCPLFAADESKPATDPLAGAFFPPELVLLARDSIGLTQQQQEAIHARMEQTQPHSDELRTRLQKETAALAALAKQEPVDEAALGAQLDKVLDVERELKHLHIGTLAAIKNLLTPPQQVQLRQIAKDGGSQIAEVVRNRITGKVEQVKQGVQDWTASGRNPSPFIKTMHEKVGPLLDSGKPLDAEAELDHLLVQLKQDAKPVDSPAPQPVPANSAAPK